MLEAELSKSPVRLPQPNYQVQITNYAHHALSTYAHGP